jgi:hypothetical protein
MSSLFDQMDTTYTGVNTNVDDVKLLLRRTKKIHSDAPTRDLNQRYNIPGYRFVKREGIIQLMKDNSSGDNKDIFIANPGRTPRSIPDDYNLNTEFSNFNGDDDADSFAQFKATSQSIYKTPKTVSIEDHISNLANAHAQVMAQKQAELDLK